MSVIEVAKGLTPENEGEVLSRFFGLSRRDAATVGVSLVPVEDAPAREVVRVLRPTGAPVLVDYLVVSAGRNGTAGFPLLGARLTGVSVACRPGRRPAIVSPTILSDDGKAPRIDPSATVYGVARGPGAMVEIARRLSAELEGHAKDEPA